VTSNPREVALVLVSYLAISMIETEGSCHSSDITPGMISCIFDKYLCNELLKGDTIKQAERMLDDEGWNTLINIIAGEVQLRRSIMHLQPSSRVLDSCKITPLPGRARR